MLPILSPVLEGHSRVSRDTGHSARVVGRSDRIPTAADRETPTEDIKDY